MRCAERAPEHFPNDFIMARDDHFERASFGAEIQLTRLLPSSSRPGTHFQLRGQHPAKEAMLETKTEDPASTPTYWCSLRRKR
jgi:hypothetical protein